MNSMRTIGLIAYDTVRRARRRRHLPVLLVVALAVAGGVSYITFFGSKQYEQFYFHLMMLVLPLLSVLAAVLSSAWVLPQEIADRALHLVLARPVRRWEVIAGTYLGALAAGLGMFAVLTVIFLTAFSWRGIAFPPALAHAVVLLGVQVALFTALAQFLSLLTTPPMAAIVCILYYFLGQLVQPTLSPMLGAAGAASRPVVWALYVSLPHLNYFNLTTPVVHSWPAVPFAAVVPAVLYGAGWAALFVLLAMIRFERCEL